MNIKKKKKVYIIYDCYDGCYYYRAEIFKRYSKQFIVDSNYNHNNKAKKHEQVLNDMLSSDMIIYLRPLNEDNLLYLLILKLLGKIIIYSNDDSFSNIDPGNPSYHIKNKVAISNNFLRHSDACITTNNLLKEEYQKIVKDVYIIPNFIDKNDYIYKKRKKNSNEMRIGIVGSVQTSENINKFTSILKDIHLRYKNVVMVFFGDTDKEKFEELKKEFPNRSVFVRNVLIDDYPKVLADLNIDISLIPRKDNMFNRCKSSCKYLEMSLLKIATIAQGFSDGKSPYQSVIKNGENGFIAITDDEWQEQIERLINDKRLLNQFKENSYKFVLDNYEIKKKIDIWDKVILEIINKFKHEALIYNKETAKKLLFCGSEIINNKKSLEMHNDRLSKDNKECHTYIGELETNKGELEKSKGELERELITIKSYRFWRFRNKVAKLLGKKVV